MAWEASVRDAFECSFDAVLAIDVLGEIIEHEQTAASLLAGGEHVDLTGQNFARVAVAEDYIDEFLGEVKRLVSLPPDCESSEVRSSMQLRLKDSSNTELLVDVRLCRTTFNNTPAVNVCIRDASDRVKAEARLAQQTVQSRLFQRAMAFTLGSDSYDDALRHSLSILSEITEWPVGHVYVPDTEGNSLIPTDIWHFEDENDSKMLRSRLGNLAFARGQGLPGRIWETGEPAWISDVREDASLIRGRVFREAGVCGVFAFPVLIGEQVIAVMEFFSPEPMAPDPQLLLMVGNIGAQLGRLMERSRAQEEQARQAAIVEASSDAIIGKSMDGTIVTWNKGAEHVYGYAVAEVLGRDMSMLIPADVQKEEQEIVDVAAHGHLLDSFETNRRRSDGSLIPVSISASPIRNRDGDIVGTASIERDITQRKQREAELEQARDAAEAAARTKGQFLANVSHELRTPLNAIIGMIDLSFQEELSPRLRDYMETVRDASRTLLDLINDVLDFSRMEVGTFHLVEEAFDLRDLLDRTIRTLAIRADEKGLNLACRIHTDVPECLQGDGRRLRQVVMNLVGNAIKFTDEGEVVVEVGICDIDDSTVHDPEPGQVRLQFSVTDTGAGIAPEFHESIFEPFSQVDESSTRTYSGSGLGLAICRELIQKMGGDITVRSEAGEGSCFSFLVPFQLATEKQVERLERFEPTGDLIGLRVLVVDDNQTNRAILEDLLTRWKMHPVLADTGEAALDVLRQAADDNQRFPLILLDALMPRMDGFMLLETASEEHLLDGATVLMLSSAERQSLKQLCDEAPVAAFLEKPVSQSDLFDSIITALHGSGLQVEETRSLPPAERPLRLLVAEDTPANQKVARLMLEQRGHDVTIVENGLDALNAVEQGGFDIVLMDLQMPLMDGLTATRRIRALNDQAVAAIPIVALTAHAVAGDQERCLQAGMDAYVAKPIELFELIRTVEEAVGLNVGRLTATRTLASDTETSTVPEPDNRVFNYDVALSRLNGNADLLRDMVSFFAEDAPRLLSEIDAAIDSGMAAQVRRAAHSLKGLCANFEAEAARDVALAMENAGRDSDLDLARKLFPRLSAEGSRLKDALSRI